MPVLLGSACSQASSFFFYPGLMTMVEQCIKFCKVKMWERLEFAKYSSSIFSLISRVLSSWKAEENDMAKMHFFHMHSS